MSDISVNDSYLVQLITTIDDIPCYRTGLRRLAKFRKPAKSSRMLSALRTLEPMLHGEWSIVQTKLPVYQNREVTWGFLGSPMEVVKQINALPEVWQRLNHHNLEMMLYHGIMPWFTRKKYLESLPDYQNWKPKYDHHEVFLRSSRQELIDFIHNRRRDNGALYDAWSPAKQGEYTWLMKRALLHPKMTQEILRRAQDRVLGYITIQEVMET